MILDKYLLFSDGQALTIDAESTNTVDLVAGGDAIGQELTFECRVQTAFACAASDTIQIKIQTADPDTGSVEVPGGTAFKDLVISPVIKPNGLVAGTTLFKIRLPQGAKRFLRAYYDVSFTGATSTFTAGKVSAWASKEL